MQSAQDVAIIGGGIVGLAHAWSAARRGHRVTVFERSDRAAGATVRNFGMIWPIGQPSGQLHAIALHSRERWLELSREAGVWANPCGSIHLAHRADEWEVIQEFAQEADELGYDCHLLDRHEVRQRSPAANVEGLIGGLFSPTELCVNPRTAPGQISSWLASRFGVQLQFGTAITAASDGRVTAADGRSFESQQTIICGGADFHSLFPTAFEDSGLKRCKLQMLKAAQPADWQLGPHLASGLTLRHYGNFAFCDSLTALRQRVATETPELDQFGIHVMASQNDAGDVILGDSHEYNAAIEPFDKAVIDELMLRELRKILALPSWTITERWHGVYAKHPTQAYFVAEPQPGVKICTGLGGAGMTMSFGLAEHLWKEWK